MKMKTIFHFIVYTFFSPELFYMTTHMSAKNVHRYSILTFRSRRLIGVSFIIIKPNYLIVRYVESSLVIAFGSVTKKVKFAIYRIFVCGDNFDSGPL